MQPKTAKKGPKRLAKQLANGWLEGSECGAFHCTIREIIPKCGGIWVEWFLG